MIARSLLAIVVLCGTAALAQFNGAGMSGPTGGQYALDDNVLVQYSATPAPSGQKRALEQGKQLGRPRIPAELEKRIQSLLRAKKGMLAIAKECSVGTGTVQHIAREMAANRPFDDANAAA